MVGPPGAGKSMLARRLPSLLPPLEPAEMLEVSMIRSLAGDLVLPQAAEGSAEVRARVAAARRIQAARFASLGLARVRTNAECDGSLLEEISSPEPSQAPARCRRYAVFECARLPPDFTRGPDGEEKVARIHIAEALSYRGETLRRAAVAASGTQLKPF